MIENKNLSKAIQMISPIIFGLILLMAYLFFQFAFHEAPYLYLLLIGAPILVIFTCVSGWAKRTVLILAVVPILAGMAWVDYRSTFQAVTFTNKTDQTLQVQLISSITEETVVLVEIEPDMEQTVHFRDSLFRFMHLKVNGETAYVHNFGYRYFIEEKEIEHAGVLYQHTNIDKAFFSSNQWSLWIVDREDYQKLMTEWMGWPMHMPEETAASTQPATQPTTQSVTP